MDWDKAKNYTIISLIILNILLLSLNLFNLRKNMLTNTQKKDITQVLENNSIYLDCDIPDKFQPMPSLSMDMYEFDQIKMQKLFFSDMSKVVRTNNKDEVIFKQDNNQLILMNNTFKYTGIINEINEEKEAKSVSNTYIHNLSSVLGNYDLYNEKRISNGYSFEYFQRYNRYNIFINKAVVNIYKNNIEITGVYYKLNENNINNSEIISADEALFSAMWVIKQEYNTKALINDIDLGYYYNNSLNNKSIVAVPSYRLVMSDNSVFYINGYSGLVEQE